MSRFKLITSVYLLLIKGNKILLSRRFQTGYMDGHYSLPAGHLEDGETIRQALVREVKEEIGINIKQDDIKLVHIMHRKEEDIRVDLFFTLNSYHDKPTNAEPEKCDDLSWFPLDNLPDNILPYIRQAITGHLRGRFYSEIGWT